MRMREAEKKLAAEVSAWFAQAEATDAADDREHGAELRGDEMPDWVANKTRPPASNASAPPRWPWRQKQRRCRPMATKDRAPPRA